MIRFWWASTESTLKKKKKKPVIPLIPDVLSAHWQTERVVQEDIWEVSIAIKGPLYATVRKNRSGPYLHSAF